MFAESLTSSDAVVLEEREAEINDDNMVKSRNPSSWTPRSVNCVFTPGLVCESGE